MSRGAQEIFELLPHEWVSSQDLPDLVSSASSADLNKCYGVVAELEDYIVPSSGSPATAFNKTDYYAEPHNFKSIFNELYLPYTSVLMNCMFWTQSYPRIVTDEQLRDLELHNQLRLLSIGDISCDFEGSVECLKKFSTIEDPYYMYDPQTGLM